MSKPLKRFYEFGPFRIDTVNRCLLEHGQPVPLKQKAIETLLVLVEHKGEVLEKEALMQRLWPESFVEEANLTQNIYLLRKALGADDYIETIPRRGYRFTAEVREWEEGTPDLILKERTRARILINEEEEIQEPLETQKAIEPLAAPSATNWTRRRISLLTLSALLMLAALLTIASYLRNSSQSKQTPAGSVIKSIAVLPFESLSVDGSDDYLRLGMADTLITKLSSLGRVVVRPTDSVRNYTDTRQDAIKAGQALGVDWVLDGSIQRVGDRVRVTVRLMRTSDGQPLWADKFDQQFTDIFKVQDVIAERLTGTLALKLSGAEQQLLAKRYTANTEAYQLYLKGRYFWNKRTEDGLKKSIEYFLQATQLDPTYALAYAGLADAYAQLPGYSATASMEIYPKAKQAAGRALELDPNLAEAHCSAAIVLSYFEWDWTAAEEEYRKALALDPHYATAHHRLGVQLAALGRTTEALNEIKHALELDPLSLIINSLLGFSYFQAQQYDQAIEQLQKTIELDANFPPAREMLARVYAEKGRPDEAFAQFLQSRKLAGETTEKLSAFQTAYTASGLKGVYRQQLDFLLASSSAARVQPTDVASLYARLGEKAPALNWLERAVEQHEGEVIWLKVLPDYESLRAEPRFADLLRRSHLDK